MNNETARDPAHSSEQACAGWETLSLKPLHGLQSRGVDSRGRTLWTAVGLDPQFECVLPPGERLAGGWYYFQVDARSDEDPFVAPVLYPDYGAGVEEASSIRLPALEQPSVGHGSVIRLVAAVARLRFDPSVAPVQFSIASAKLRRLGKLEAAGRMLLGALRATPTLCGRLDLLVRISRQLLVSGVSHMADLLYAEYSRCADHFNTSADAYQRWIALYDRMPDDGDLSLLRQTPLISVLLPTYNPPEKWLRKCLDSVIAQSYPHWELCIVDDASTKPYVRRALNKYARRDPRIRVTYRHQNGHISASSNDALAQARGDFVALLDHDDELHREALFEVARAIDRNRNLRIVFSDEDKIDQNEMRYDPYFKSDWNPDLFLSHNCISHLGVYSTDLVRDVGGFREGLEGSQDWDLALRCIERLEPHQIGHVARVLYHWRAIPGSTALAPQEKDYAHGAGLRAIGEYLARTGSTGVVCEKPGYRGNYRVRYPLPDPAPRVSIVIPTRDGLALLRRCIDSIRERSTYCNYEVLVVDNQSVEQDTLDYLAYLQLQSTVRVLSYDAPFNYSAINNFAVAAATGDVVILLNDDVEVISPGWMEELVGQALRPEVGAVGAMLYYPNETIQHAGVIVGVHGAAAHAYCGKPRGWPGQMNRAKLQQNLSAVTAACLAIEKRKWVLAGGLDESFRVAYNDVDFCLRLRSLALWNVWTPYAELYHHESATRGSDARAERVTEFTAERSLLLSRWSAAAGLDPAYNCNLSATDELFTLAFPPRSSQDFEPFDGAHQRVDQPITFSS